MTVEIVEGGDIFESDAAAIVIPVNCVGTCGKGLALEAKRRWPGWYKHYRRACERSELSPGEILVLDARGATPLNPLVIISLATKDHWRNPSQFVWVELGLVSLAAWAHGAREWLTKEDAIAVPALGCGNGGLRWEDVRPRMALLAASAPWMAPELPPLPGEPRGDRDEGPRREATDDGERVSPSPEWKGKNKGTRRSRRRVRR